MLAAGWRSSSSASPSQWIASALKEQLAVKGIGRVAGGEPGHIAAAEAGNQHRPGCRNQGHQFSQMFLAALGDRVWEQGQVALAPSGVLDLYIDRSGVGRGCSSRA